MKRYLLFSGKTPLGGWLDFREAFRSLRDAEGAVREGEWYQIVDCADGRILKQRGIDDKQNQV